MKWVKVLSAITVCSFLSSCITIGEEFSSNINWLEIGKTKKKEVIDRLGQPFRTGYDSGQLTYTYLHYKYSIISPTQTKDLVIRFADGNTIASYTFSSSFKEDKETIR